MIATILLFVESTCPRHKALEDITTDLINDPWHEISNNVVYATSKASDQPAHMRRLISFEYSMSVKLLTKHHL